MIGSTRLTLTALACLLIGSLGSPVSVSAQEAEDTNYWGYDKSFIDRPDHKRPTNPFAAKAEDFHEHTYHHKLLKSEFANSSAALGVNSTNRFYNKDAYTYMNPDSFKANDVTPEELERYIDHAYAPKLQKSDNPAYNTSKDFNSVNPFGMEAPEGDTGSPPSDELRRFNSTPSSEETQDSNPAQQLNALQQFLPPSSVGTMPEQTTGSAPDQQNNPNY
ncbi:MAG: hypothetical protein K2X93_13485 [Candidatus Obscuribacterales bacterium]|nr:hypothetical protein [Candidatus Obscuribacterales bacterium]